MFDSCARPASNLRSITRRSTHSPTYPPAHPIPAAAPMAQSPLILPQQAPVCAASSLLPECLRHLLDAAHLESLEGLDTHPAIRSAVPARPAVRPTAPALNAACPLHNLWTIHSPKACLDIWSWTMSGGMVNFLIMAC